ncbi:MAG: hypothetical protein ACRDDL_06195, partial [Sarcina sp.]
MYIQQGNYNTQQISRLNSISQIQIQGQQIDGVDVPGFPTQTISGEDGTKFGQNVQNIIDNIAKEYTIEKVTYNGQPVSINNIANLVYQGSTGNLTLHIKNITQIIVHAKFGDNLLPVSSEADTINNGKGIFYIPDTGIYANKNFYIKGVNINGVNYPFERKDNKLIVNGPISVSLNGQYNVEIDLGHKSATNPTPVAPTYSDTVNIMDGSTQVSSETTTGVAGTQIKIPTLPSGAKITSVEVNGVKQATNSYPTEIGNENQTITINVEMPHTATVEYKEGDTTIGSAVTTGVEGTTIKYAAAPTGYKIKSITVNGQVVDSMPTTLGNANETIIVTYEKVAVPVKPEAKKVTLTVEATSGGKTLFSET